MTAFAPDATGDGKPPPREVAKAFAFHTVLKKVGEILENSPSDLVGMRGSAERLKTCASRNRVLEGIQLRLALYSGRRNASTSLKS